MSTEPIGVVGIGHMGLPMSRRLIAAGYTVVAYDLSPEAIRAAVNGGAEAAESAVVAPASSACSRASGR